MSHRYDVKTERGRHVVIVRGDVGQDDADDLRQILEGQVAAGIPVLVDCSKVAFIDARGLGSLICARYAACDAGVGFHLLGVSDSMRQVMRAAGIDDFFPLAEPS